MQMRNRILGIGLSAIVSLGVMAAPAAANAADHWRDRDSRNDHRTNAALLGIAGVILVGNHKDTLGAIALGAAAVEASRGNDRCDDGRYRRGHDSWYDAVLRNGRNRRDRDRDCDDNRYGRNRRYDDRYGRDRDCDRDGRYRRDRDCDRDGDCRRDRDRDRDRDCDGD